MRCHNTYCGSFVPQHIYQGCMHLFYFIRFIIWLFWNNNNIPLNAFEYCNWNHYDIHKAIHDIHRAIHDIHEGIHGVIGCMDVNQIMWNHNETETDLFYSPSATINTSALCLIHGRINHESLSRLCENQPAATQCVKINSTELCSDIKNIYIFFRYATLAFSFFYHKFDSFCYQFR